MVKNIVKVLVRFGFIVRGLFYILTGLSGVVTAFGISRNAKDTSEIVKMFAVIPFGKVLLIATFFGFVGYGIWGVVRTQRKGKTILRFGYLVSGLSYLVLSLIPLHLFLNLSSGGPVNYKVWSQFLINLPYGFVLVVILGVVIMIGGVGQIIYSVQGKFKKSLNNMDKGKKKEVLVVTGEFGYVIRGIIFTLIGFFFLESGISGNASKAKDPREILMWSWQQNGGPFILGGISLGLIALGIYSVMSARVVRIS